MYLVYRCDRSSGTNHFINLKDHNDQDNSIHANFPDLVGIFPILHAIPDFPIGIPNNTRNPDFVKIHPDLRQ